jgi:hypothetical protein
LAGLSEDNLLADVGDFVNTHGLQDIAPLLEKGALVAANPDDFESIDRLTTEEKHVLRMEVEHKWRHPLALYVTIFVCSMGAAVQVRSPNHTFKALLIVPRAGIKLARMAQISASLPNSALDMAMILIFPTTTVITGLLVSLMLHHIWALLFAGAG